MNDGNGPMNMKVNKNKPFPSRENRMGCPNLSMAWNHVYELMCDFIINIFPKYNNGNLKFFTRIEEKGEPWTPLGWGGFKFENWWTWPNYMELFTRIIAVSL